MVLATIISVRIPGFTLTMFISEMPRGYRQQTQRRPTGYQAPLVASEMAQGPQIQNFQSLQQEVKWPRAKTTRIPPPPPPPLTTSPHRLMATSGRLTAWRNPSSPQSLRSKSPSPYTENSKSTMVQNLNYFIKLLRSLSYD